MNAELRALETTNPAHWAAAAAIWNAACGPELAITPEAVRFNTRPSAGGVQAGRLAWVGAAAQPAGIVLASAFPAGDPVVSPPELGWIDAIAVSPRFRRHGIGAALLAWAEGWLAAQGCTGFALGGSLRPFAPGLPTTLGSEGYFRSRGYDHWLPGKREWDVARRLRDYTAPASVRPGMAGAVRPARPGEEDALLAFFGREFPGRWRFEFQEHLREGGRISDYLILQIDQGIEGFCQLTFEDSLRPLDRFFMHGLPRPWGQLGPIGVSQARRGGGYGAAVLHAGLCRLRDAGVDGCIIDWTSLVDFYGKFGFNPHRQYEMLMHDTADQSRRTA